MKSIQVTIHTPANDLEKSKAFYKKLRFEVVSESEPTLVSDGKFIIEIADDKYARSGLKLYKKDWTDEVAKLREFTEVMEHGTGFLASDPNGVMAYLWTEEFGQYAKPEDVSGMPGNFAGISLESVDFAGTCKFWESLGYEQGDGTIEQGWVTYTNGSDVE